MTKKILFLYLNAFSVTGGIEKFNKAFMKALQDISKEDKIKYKAFSAYDNESDLRYVDKESYKGFKGRKFSFAFNSVNAALKTRYSCNLGISISHSIGLIIKLLKPNVRLILIAHGVEVWDELSFIKKISYSKS